MADVVLSIVSFLVSNRMLKRLFEDALRDVLDAPARHRMHDYNMFQHAIKVITSDIDYIYEVLGGVDEQSGTIRIRLDEQSTLRIPLGEEGEKCLLQIQERCFSFVDRLSKMSPDMDFTGVFLHMKNNEQHLEQMQEDMLDLITGM